MMKLNKIFCFCMCVFFLFITFFELKLRCFSVVQGITKKIHIMCRLYGNVQCTPPTASSAQ